MLWLRQPPRSRARPGPYGRAEEAVQVILAERQDDIARIPRIDLAEVREVEPVADWETVLEILLLDHSAAGEDDAAQAKGRRKAKPSSQESAVDEAWRLEEVEEGV